MERANKDTQAAHGRAAAEPEASRATVMADLRPSSVAQRALAGWASSSQPAQLAGPDELQQQKSADTAQRAPEPEEQEPGPA